MNSEKIIKTLYQKRKKIVGNKLLNIKKKCN